MTKITLTYCGMAGEGQTVKEAKQDAARKIEAALNASYEPKMLTCEGHQALVWRTPTGIVSAYLHDGKIGGTCQHSTSSMAEVIRSTAYNLALNVADIESDTVPMIIAFDKQAVRDFEQWLGFQRAYRHAKANSIGAGDSDWHRYACDNGRTFAPQLQAA